MLKLLNVDAEGERALRVVSYFDQLLANQPDLESVVRATAILADCTAGLRAPGELQSLRFTRDGNALSAHTDAPKTASAPLILTEFAQVEGSVWLERDDAKGNLDEFILERMALTATSVLRRHHESRSIDRAAGFSDPALADLLVNERANETDRSRAARLMGLDPGQSIQLVAIRPDAQTGRALDDVSTALRAGLQRPVHLAQMTNDLLLAVVVTHEPIMWTEAPISGCAASGPVVNVTEAPRSWARAREGLRFAGLGPSWPRVVETSQIGALTMLLALDANDVRAQADVLSIQKLHDSASGSESIQILDLALHTDSLRSAAREANFHHSSIQTRLHRIEKHLGMELRSGAGRQRAAHALLLWQLFRT